MAPGGDQGDQPPLTLNEDLDDGEHQTGGRLDRRRTGVQRRDEVPRALEVGKVCSATKTGSGGSAREIGGSKGGLETAFGDPRGKCMMAKCIIIHIFVRYFYDYQKHLNKDLEIEGVLITMYDNRLNLSRQVVHELQEYFGDKVYKTYINRNLN